jgi:primosomal protein N'
VIAPFRNEKLIGVVTGLNAKVPAEVEVRFLEAVLDEEPLLSDQLLTLAEWMAQYYLAPLGEVLRGMLPLMAEVRRTVYYRITDLGRDVLAGSLDGDSVRFQVSKARPPDPARGGGHPCNFPKSIPSGAKAHRRIYSALMPRLKRWPTVRNHRRRNPSSKARPGAPAVAFQKRRHRSGGASFLPKSRIWSIAF